MKTAIYILAIILCSRTSFGSSRENPVIRKLRLEGERNGFSEEKIAKTALNGGRAA